MTASALVVLANIIYYGLGWMKPVLGAGASWVVAALILAVYLVLVRIAAREPDLAIDDPNAPVLELPPIRETLLAGLHFLLPVVLLIWALMVEHLSPGLSAFYGTVMLAAILVTQRPLIALFRKEAAVRNATRRGFEDLVEGLALGARNMIGIGIATAAAGIVVGTVSITGLGLVMTEFVETVSAGNLVAMLVLVAVICLILGMGMPTTASYIIVSTLMAPVLVELGAQSGLVIPLVAVHMFVFYFGLMADVTPPVGLASFAAAAISRADPIRTGITAFWYSIRTGILPFMFVFNTQLLLIGVDSWAHVALVVVSAIVAMLMFAAGTQGWFVTRSRWYESVLLLLVTFTLLRPDYWLDFAYSRFQIVPATQLAQIVKEAPEGGAVRLRLEGTTLEGRDVKKTVRVELAPGSDVRSRLAPSGLTLLQTPDGWQVAAVRLNSPADKAGFEQGFRITGIEQVAARPAKEWMYLPALAVIALVWWLQRRRAPPPASGAMSDAPRIREAHA
jgi:TRAP transporter 4TM/12TM fusion protein